MLVAGEETALDEMGFLESKMWMKCVCFRVEGYISPSMAWRLLVRFESFVSLSRTTDVSRWVRLASGVVQAFGSVWDHAEYLTSSFVRKNGFRVFPPQRLHETQDDKQYVWQMILRNRQFWGVLISTSQLRQGNMSLNTFSWLPVGIFKTYVLAGATAL